jgi:hypothetical protein
MSVHFRRKTLTRIAYKKLQELPGSTSCPTAKTGLIALGQRLPIYRSLIKIVHKHFQGAKKWELASYILSSSMVTGFHCPRVLAIAALFVSTRIQPKYHRHVEVNALGFQSGFSHDLG